jgi:hypothetical protein
MYIGIFVSYVLSFVFLVFALVGFGLRLTQTVFHFLPETLHRVAKKFGADAAFRAVTPQCVSPNKSRTNRDAVYESRRGSFLCRHASHLHETRCDAEGILWIRS